MPLHWFLFGLACAAALPAAFTLDPVLDTDTWWHMATGRWIVWKDDVPWVDPFSQLSRATPTRWYAYSWIYDIVLFKIFDNCSFTGIILYRTILVSCSTLAVMSFLVWRSGNTLKTVIVALLTGVVLMMFAKERPWHFTIAFTTITLWVVQAMRERGFHWTAVCLMPLFALWANLHIQFVLGWLILAVAIVLPGKVPRRAFVALTIGCIAACAINPYHVRLVQVILEYVTQSAPRELVQELAPPALTTPSTWATIAIVTIGFVSAIRTRPIDIFSLVLLFLSLMLAATMRRDIWFAVLAAIGCLTPMKPHESVRKAKVMIAILISILGIRGINMLGVGPTTDYESAQTRQYPPFGVETYLTGVLRSQPCFNHFDWGGYIIWYCSYARVSIDGRTNLYGSERLRRSFLTWDGVDWPSDHELINSKVVVAPVNCELAKRLRQYPDIWKIRFENDVTIIFLKFDYFYKFG